MFETIGFFSKLAASLIFVNPVLGKIKKVREKDGDEAADKYIFEFVKDWSQKRLNDTGCHIFVHGAENIPENQNVLFVSNHQSNLDFVLLLAKLNKPVGFIAKVELEKIPLLRDWMRVINCLFMDRDDMRQQVKTIVEGINLLKSGKSMVVFPEGTRSKDGKMIDFKAGSFKLATKSKVPIVPVTIDGTFNALEGNGNKLIPGDINLYIHEPVHIDRLSKEEADSLNVYVRNIIIRPLEEKYGKQQ
ncbi:1-acyl-sn-glycerol-3-phosphate acyltransferase [Lachnospiraceae bacterium NSJ-143]|nr:1-acyl-sn-glycerol-3-phosphate acyltransferase [Lachnospiraceae bacterium NSJ-143]